jgi:signal transduction histidine kinase
MELAEKDKTILLVDDEEDIRDVLGMSLMDLGYQVYTAENGQQALASFAAMNPAIVLTDIKMPVMDGIEVLRRVKAENAETEVIMITGHGDMDLAIKSLKHQASDFITKPINVDALEIALKRTEERILIRQKLKEYTENLETLIREKSELQNHLASLGLMIGSISHGIKGLLTGLDGGMYILEAGIKRQASAQIGDGLGTVKLMVERIRKLVLDILYYAKRRELQRESVDAHQFAREVAQAIEPKIKAQGIEFICRLNEAAGCCEIDTGYIHAALSNIFENAIDACNKREPPTGARITFRLDADSRQTIFAVQDNGIGMDDDTKEMLFTCFFSSKGRGGTGLGLFVAHRIVEQHGGAITVNSSPGKGSVFTVHIPRIAPAL